MSVSPAGLTHQQQLVYDEIVNGWSNRVHETPLRAPFPVGGVRQGGVTDALIRIAAKIAAEMIEDARAEAYEQGWDSGASTASY